MKKTFRFVLHSLLALIITVGVLVGGFFFGEDIDPLTLSRVELSNGPKTVIFQQMAHIAHPRFYDTIAQDLERARGEGFVYYYEGVQPSQDPTRNTQLLSRLSKGTAPEIELRQFYQLMADMTGLVLQPQDRFTQPQDHNIDISVDDLFEQLPPAPTTSNASSAADIETIEKSLAEMTPSLRARVGHVLRNMVSGLFRLHPVLPSSKVLDMQLILHQRDHLLVESLKNGPSRIYVTYGAAHFPGVLQGLQAQDARWAVVKRTPIRIFQP